MNGEKKRIWMLWKIMVLVVMAGAMLFVWPVHPLREVTTRRSGDEGHLITEPLQIGESLTQYFRMPADNVIQLEFVLTGEEDGFGDGQLLFEFLDPQGNVLQEQLLDCAQLPDYSYTGVVVNLRTRRGAEYAYRLTNVSVAEAAPCGVWVADPAMQVLQKARLVDAQGAHDGELLTRLTTNSPVPLANSMALWGCIALVGFSCIELLILLEGALGRKK